MKQQLLNSAAACAAILSLASCEAAAPPAVAGAATQDAAADIAIADAGADTAGGGSPADIPVTATELPSSSADAPGQPNDVAADTEASPADADADVAPDDAPSDAAPDTDTKPAPPPVLVPADSAIPGTQYNGSVAYLRKAAPGLAWAEEFVEISAPITPKTQVIYPKQGDKFPQDLAGMQTLAHEAALTYDYLLTVCAKDYPGITLLPPEAPKVLPADKLSMNFELTAQCSYEKWTAKPYWIPMLVDKVDICATELGLDWALLAEADVASLTAEQVAVLKKGLTPSGKASFGNFYFSTKVFVRAAKGLLMTGALEVGAALKTIEDSMPCKQCFPDPWTYHLEGGTTLRCIRVRGVKEAK